MISLGDFQFDLVGMISNLVPIALRVGLIVVISSVIQKIISKFIQKTIHFSLIRRKDEGKSSYEKRKETIARVVSGTAAAIIWAIAFVIILDEVGINIGPILAGAGVAGLAVSFGAR